MGGGGATGVAKALNEAQRGGAAAHRRWSGLLGDRLRAGEPAEALLAEIRPCLERLLLSPKREAPTERAVRFVVTFLCTPDGLDGAKAELAEGVLAWLASRSMALDRGVRFRCCQLVAGVLNAFSGEIELDDGLLDAVAQAMALRLNDREPQVRALATRALARLQDPGESGDFSDDPATLSFMAMLKTEKVKLVRKHVLASVAVSDFTVSAIIEHTRDVAEDVRSVTFKVLGSKVPMRSLSIEQRAVVMRRGLEERSAGVKTAAVAMLKSWLDQAGGQPEELLRAMDVETHEQVAELMVRALLDAGALDAVEFAEAAAKAGTGLRSPASSPPLSPEAALLWRVVVEVLYGEANNRGHAAAVTMGAEAQYELSRATQSTEALEGALPDTASGFVQLLARHAAAGYGHSFATRQLLHILARCVDFTDISGRSAAGDLVKRLLRLQPESLNGRDAPENPTLRGDGGDNAWEESIGEAAVKIFAEQVTQELFGAVKDLATEWKIGEGTRPELWVQCLAITSLPLKYARSRSTVIEQHCQELLDDLVLPGVQHPSPAVRREAVNVVGLLCLLEIPLALGHAKILRAALQVDTPQVQAAAARALLDFALVRGPAMVDSYCLEPPSSDSPVEDPKALVFVRPLLEVLEEQLFCWDVSTNDCEETVAELDQDKPKSVIAEGLARLLMHAHILPASAGFERQDNVRVLQKLLQAYSGASTDQCPYMRQCLAVFFDAYVSFSAEHQQILASAVVPLLRAARASGKLRPVQALAAYVARLLQVPLRGQPVAGAGPDQDPRDSLDQSGLIVQLVGEILHCGKCPDEKGYIVLLAKVAASLPLAGAAETSLRQLREALDRALAGISGNATATKELKALREGVLGMREGLDEALDAVELECLEKSLEVGSADVGGGTHGPDAEGKGPSAKKKDVVSVASGSKRPSRKSSRNKSAEGATVSEEAGVEVDSPEVEGEAGEDQRPSTPEEAPPKKRSAAKGGGTKRQMTRATGAQKAAAAADGGEGEENNENAGTVRVSPPTKRTTRSTRSSSRTAQKATLQNKN